MVPGVSARLAALVTASLAVAGCSPVSAVTDRTAAPASTAPAETAAPEAVSMGGDRWALTYRDVAGRDRTFHVEIRHPSNTSGTPPAIVVWSHGGSTGKEAPERVAAEWGRVANRAGGAFVAIAHPGRSRSDWDALCVAVEAADCSQFNPLLWDRPHDFTALVDWLERSRDTDDLDTDRIVYGGHSAGAFGALTTAGMTWPYDSARAPAADPRPIAFIIASPPGAAARGFDDASFAELDRPLLMLSGDGDTTEGSSAPERRQTLALLPADTPAVTLWILDEATRHTTLDLDTASCRRGGAPSARCNEIVRTIARTGTEFIEAVSEDAFDPDAFAAHLAERAPPYAEVLTPTG